MGLFSFFPDPNTALSPTRVSARFPWRTQLADMAEAKQAAASDQGREAPDADLVREVEKLWPAFSAQEPHSTEGGVQATCAVTPSACRAPSEQGGHLDLSHVYGEVLLGPFADFLCSLPLPAAGSVFVDLGSGAGVAVAAAWCSCRFKTCVGVEVDPARAQAASERAVALQAAFPPAAEAAAEGVRPSLAPLRTEHNGVSRDILLLEGSMFDADCWLQAAQPSSSARQPLVVFCNSTALNIAQMQALGRSLESLPGDSLVITTTTRLPSKLFTHSTWESKLPMSWGSSATVHLARRRRVGKWAAAMLTRS